MFLDLDHRQSEVQSAVHTLVSLKPSSPIVTEWESVQQRCYNASAAYISATSPTGPTGFTETGPRPSATEVRSQLNEARSTLDSFYARHQRALDGAVAETTATTARAATLLMQAQTMQGRLSGADGQWLQYPSVQSAHDGMQTATRELQLAQQRSDLVATRDTTERLDAAIEALGAVLDSAPGAAEKARRTVSSVRTRLAAVRTRGADVEVSLSTLLREFHANCSADLVDNERRSRADLDSADALLQQAVLADRQGRAETALELAQQARAAIGAAEDLVDAPLDRLTVLRTIRDNPSKPEQAVRFRLRDAQRLAVDRDAVAEWGSVLDAQVERIDRIVGALQGRHPDYWGYHLALEEVSEFVAGIVTRIRQRSAR